MRILVSIVLLLLVSHALLGCSDDGKGQFNLDEVKGSSRIQKLTINTDGQIAAVELDLPFDPSNTIPSSISVALDQTGVPGDTHMDFVVKPGEGKLKVSILNGRDKGFDGQGPSLILSYTMLADDPSLKLFSQVEPVKVLDTQFQNKNVTWRWTE